MAKSKNHSNHNQSEYNYFKQKSISKNYANLYFLFHQTERITEMVSNDPKE